MKESVKTEIQTHKEVKNTKKKKPHFKLYAEMRVKNMCCRLDPLYVGLLCSLYVLPHSKNMHVKQIGNSNLSLDANESASGCSSLRGPVMD